MPMTASWLLYTRLQATFQDSMPEDCFGCLQTRGNFNPSLSAEIAFMKLEK